MNSQGEFHSIFKSDFTKGFDSLFLGACRDFEEKNAHIKCLETLENPYVNIRLLKLKLTDLILYLTFS